MKRLLAHLGLIKLVWLQDKDLEVTLRIKRKNPFGGYLAFRTNYMMVNLNPDGTCSGCDWVSRWKDFKPTSLA